MMTGSSTSIIPAVSDSLRKFICAHVPLLSEGSVTFDSPAGGEAGEENRLLVYLYRVELNPYLRNLPATLVLKQARPDRSASLLATPAPLVVDLLYMMVAIGRTGEYEQMIVNGVVQLLDTCGVLPQDYLTPTLTDSGNDALAIVPEATSIHELRDLWSAFSQEAYHFTKLYTVPAVRIPAATPRPVDMTLTARTDGMTLSRTDLQ